ncbi:MAG: hypothetical protein Kow00117_04630 [Phototrophicales bacterium]
MNGYVTRESNNHLNIDNDRLNSLYLDEGKYETISEINFCVVCHALAIGDCADFRAR